MIHPLTPDSIEERTARGVLFRRLRSCEACGCPRYDKPNPALVFVPPRRSRWALQVIPLAEQRSWAAYMNEGSIKRAADSLGVHEQTIKRHLANIRSRLGVETNAQAAVALSLAATKVSL